MDGRGASSDSTERTEGGGVYSIGAVARMLGMPTQTLRAWEERYQLVVPERSEGGQRLYSREQVDQLLFIRTQLEQGLQPADAHRLLAQQQRQAAPPAHPPPVVPEDGPGPSVLIAERDAYAAEFSDYFLRTEGYDVQVVLDPDSATQILRERPPSLLVVDLLIAGGAGLSLCRTAREEASVPVLAVSAVDSRDEALTAGAEAFLLKPLDPLKLVSTIRDLIGTSAYLRPRRRAR